MDLIAVGCPVGVLATHATSQHGVSASHVSGSGPGEPLNPETPFSCVLKTLDLNFHCMRSLNRSDSPPIGILLKVSRTGHSRWESFSSGCSLFPMDSLTLEGSYRSDDNSSRRYLLGYYYLWLPICHDLRNFGAREIDTRPAPKADRPRV